MDDANKVADEKLKNPYINDTRYQSWRSSFAALKGRNPTVEEYEAYLKNSGITNPEKEPQKNPTTSENTNNGESENTPHKHQTGTPIGPSGTTNTPTGNNGSHKSPTNPSGSSTGPSTGPNVQPGTTENPGIEEPNTPNTPSTNPANPSTPSTPTTPNNPGTNENPGIEEPTVDTPTVQDTAKNVVDTLLGQKNKPDNPGTTTNPNGPSSNPSNTGSSNKPMVSDNSILSDFMSESQGQTTNPNSGGTQTHSVDEIVEAQNVRDALKEEIEKRQQEGSLSDEEIQELNQKVEVLDQKISEAKSALVVNVPVVDMFYKDGSQLKIGVYEGLNPAANKEVTVIINGQKYVKQTDANGQINMNLNLDPGLYNVTVYVGSESENAIKSTITINSTIEGSDLSLFYRNGSRYEAKFLNKDGTPLAFTNVVFNINGVFYNRMTDANGIASMAINLAPGQYTITATNPVNNQQFSNLVTVKPIIQSSDLTKRYGESGAYEAKILDNNGNPLANANVRLNIHGVFYNRITDANGIAHLNINLLAGNYVITAFVDVNGGTTAQSNKITVL